MNKRGQFFLIAAFVIIGLILSVRSIQNTAFAEEEETLIYDLSDEIAFESYSVIDHGTFNSLTFEETKSNLNELTEIYADSNPDSDILAIYGDAESFEVIAHIDQPTGEVSLNAPGGNLNLPVQAQKSNLGNSASLQQSNDGSFINVLLDKENNIGQKFKLKKGQNFFIIIGKIKGRDKIIATN